VFVGGGAHAGLGIFSGMRRIRLHVRERLGGDTGQLMCDTRPTASSLRTARKTDDNVLSTVRPDDQSDLSRPKPGAPTTG